MPRIPYIEHATIAREFLHTLGHGLNEFARGLGQASGILAQHQPKLIDAENRVQKDSILDNLRRNIKSTLYSIENDTNNPVTWNNDYEEFSKAEIDKIDKNPNIRSSIREQLLREASERLQDSALELEIRADKQRLKNLHDTQLLGIRELAKEGDDNNLEEIKRRLKDGKELGYFIHPQIEKELNNAININQQAKINNAIQTNNLDTINTTLENLSTEDDRNDFKGLTLTQKNNFANKLQKVRDKLQSETKNTLLDTLNNETVDPEQKLFEIDRSLKDKCISNEKAELLKDRIKYPDDKFNINTANDVYHGINKFLKDENSYPNLKMALSTGKMNSGERKVLLNAFKYYGMEGDQKPNATQKTIARAGLKNILSECCDGYRDGMFNVQNDDGSINQRKTFSQFVGTIATMIEHVKTTRGNAKETRAFFELYSNPKKFKEKKNLEKMRNKSWI